MKERRFNLSFGAGRIVEEAEAACPDLSPVIQLLEFDDGTRALRFAHYHGPRFGRDPLVLKEDEIPAVREALAGAAQVRALLARLLAEPRTTRRRR